MTAFTYQVQYEPDETFWSQLTNMPTPKTDFPLILTLGSRMRFAYSPYGALEGYCDFSKSERALVYLAPPTPAPITSIGYLFAPQVGIFRKVYVAFFYGPGMAGLAQISPMALLHRPLGLRTDSGANYPHVNVSPVVLKGDAAPIHFDVNSEQVPALGYTISEFLTPQGTSELRIILRAPGMCTMQVNPPNGVVT